MVRNVLQPGSYDKKLTFLREISYRSTDATNLQVLGLRIEGSGVRVS